MQLKFSLPTYYEDFSLYDVSPSFLEFISDLNINSLFLLPVKFEPPFAFFLVLLNTGSEILNLLTAHLFSLMDISAPVSQLNPYISMSAI